MVNIVRKVLIILNSLLQRHLKLLQIDNKITKAQKSSQQVNSETVANEHDEEVLKERSLSPEERQGFINNLRLI